MKKFRFLFVVAVISAIFVLPSFAAEVDISDLHSYTFQGRSFLGPSVESFIEFSSSSYVTVFVDYDYDDSGLYLPRLYFCGTSEPLSFVNYRSFRFGTYPIVTNPLGKCEKYYFTDDGSFFRPFSASSVDYCAVVYANYPLVDSDGNTISFSSTPVEYPSNHVLHDLDLISSDSNGFVGYYKISDDVLSDYQLNNAFFFSRYVSRSSSKVEWAIVGGSVSLSSLITTHSSSVLPVVFSDPVTGEPGTYVGFAREYQFVYYISDIFYPDNPDPMGEIMDSTTSIFDSGLSMMASVANAVTSSPLILLVVLVPLIFVGVSLFRRFMKI